MAADPKAEKTPRLVRPEGATDEQWSLVQVCKSPEMADAILAWDDDMTSVSADDLTEFLNVSDDAAKRAMKEYLKLNSTIGRKLSAAYKLWRGHRKRTDAIFQAIADGVDGTNGE